MAAMLSRPSVRACCIRFFKAPLLLQAESRSSQAPPAFKFCRSLLPAALIAAWRSAFALEMASRSDADDFWGVVLGEFVRLRSDGLFNGLFEVAGRFDEVREGTEDIVTGAWHGFARPTVLI